MKRCSRATISEMAIYFQHRINHLLRTIPGGELKDYGDIMAKYDAALLGLPRRFVRRLQLPDHAVGLIGLPHALIRAAAVPVRRRAPSSCSRLLGR